MTRNLCWTTIVAALVALAAGAAWAEEPQKQATNTSPKCCDEKGCCTQYHVGQSQDCPSTAVQECPFCSQCAAAACCSKKKSSNHQAKAGCAKCEGCAACAKAGCCGAKQGEDTCCAGCAKDCACCKNCKCGKDVASSAGCAKGCTCCCTKAACACCCGSTKTTHTGHKKKVVVYVMEPVPAPCPPPPPMVCLPPPVPPAGAAIYVQGNEITHHNVILRQAPPYPDQALTPPPPAVYVPGMTVVETPDGVRHICGGTSCPAAPAYPCPAPAPTMPEDVPHPAPVACSPMAGPVPAQLTGNPPVPPPPAAMACSVAGPGVMACSVAGPAEAPCRCRLETTTEDGATHLKVSSGPSTCITCDHLELKVAGFSGLKVAVADKQVRLHTPMADAMADCISVTAQEDQILLEGHVHLQYHLDEGEHADVSASRVVVHLSDGRVEIHPAKPGAKATRMMPPADSPPAVFNFFTGIFH